MVPWGPSINSVWFLPVQTALFSTLCDLIIPGSGKLLVRLLIHVLCREGEGMEETQLFEAIVGAGSIKTGDRKAQRSQTGTSLNKYQMDRCS